MSYQIVDEIWIVGLQNYNVFEKINPLKLISMIVKYKGNYQDMVPNDINISLLISSSVVQDTNVIFLICNGLNNARDSLINGKLYKSIGVINISKIKDWTKLKGESKCINITFNDSENPTLAKHFAFAFETVNLNNLLNFQLSLLDDKAKPMKFALNERKYQH